MEPSTRKRKLNELDKNIPFLTGSASQLETLKGNTLKNKFHKVITPSKGSENITPSIIKDADGFENPQFQKLKDGRLNKSEGRGHMKSCDRRYRRMMSEKKDEIERSEVLRDVGQTRPPDKPVLDLSKMNITLNSQMMKDMTLEADAREIKILFASDYLEDIVCCEFEKESHRKLSSNFCKKYDLDPMYRGSLVDWLIFVQMKLKATNHTLHLAVNLMDNLLDKLYIPKDTLAVSAIASFWVAYKFFHGNLSVKPLMSLLTGGPHSIDTILCQEVLVLQSSHLLQAGGDLSTFFNYLLIKLFGFSFPPEIYYCGQYFMEIMLVHFNFVTLTGPEKAITAVYAALSLFDWKIRFKLLEFDHFIQKDKLLEMCGELMLHLRVLYSNKGVRKTNLHMKYKSPRYLGISEHDVLRGISNLG